MANEGWERPSLWNLGGRVQRARDAALEVGRKLDEDPRPGARGSASVEAPSAAHRMEEGRTDGAAERPAGKDRGEQAR